MKRNRSIACEDIKESTVSRQLAHWYLLMMKAG
jgi:hypothetical protein